ncbi:hypothetical protein SSX86_009880 [Deinandra increscens subsp. villosa]|uniref:Protein kinase domain-containing protein n=1 Tax=Deinandra increscens subsp. villosa TaxID=3103831 RepID=A0AAP0DEW7_9ASTR
MSPAVSIFLLFSLYILHTSTVTSDSLDTEERKALLDFIQNIDHNPAKFNWTDSEPACNWKGVTCDPDKTHVIFLRLPAKSLVGNIPPNTLGTLKFLRVLSLRINGFTGPIPPEFANLTGLTRLALNNNSFTGQLPFIEPKGLTGFDVSNNKLNTSIPSFFSRFPTSSFSNNIYVCGDPFENITCEYPYPDPNSHDQKNETKTRKKEGEIVVISIGSGLVLLILLCCARKKLDHMTKRRLPPPQRPVSKLGVGNKKSLEWFENGVYGFDLEELLGASAEFLGEGSVGKSYKQVVGEGKKEVVVKRLKLDVVVTEGEFVKKMEGLWGILKNRKNVVPLRGYYCSKEEKLLVYDYMDGGSLALHLHEHGSIGSRRAYLDWDHRMRIALSAARGLAYLHVAEVVHGNIKSSNILLGQETNNEAYVSDYGLNTLFGEPSSMNYCVTGYQAPELRHAHEVTFKSDVYSFGVLLVELLTGKNPNQALLSTEGGHFSKLVESVVSGEPKAEIFDVDIRNEYKMDEMLQLLRIAKKCVSIEEDQRPKIDDVLHMMDNMWLRPSSDDHSKGYDDTRSTSTDIQDTPSTITP